MRVVLYVFLIGREVRLSRDLKSVTLFLFCMFVFFVMGMIFFVFFRGIERERERKEKEKGIEKEPDR